MPIPAPPKIEFQQTRDFGQVFNTGFVFMRQHLKKIFVHLLFIGGPFLLVGAGISAILLVRVSSLGGPYPAESNRQWYTSLSVSNMLVPYAVNIVSFLVGMVMITAVINAYLKLYKESPQAQPSIDLNDVWAEVKRDFWWLAGRLLVLNLLVMVYFVLWIGLGILVFGSGSSVGLKIGLGFLYVVGLLVMSFYLMPYFAGVFLTQSYFERTPFFTSITRTFYLVKHHWWLTFGLGFVALIIEYAVIFILYLPFYLLAIVSVLLRTGNTGSATSNIPLTVFVSLGTAICLAAGYLLVFIIHYVLAGVHYHNLLERKESVGLLNKIQTLGTAPNTPSAPVDFYEEEEKY